ncbi:BAH and coiled-coil domain-containing protein 1 [Nymphon striatum]|nr:BAH and coiled-coil domain-containing protein 1 [Nymphon striatum]
MASTSVTSPCGQMKQQSPNPNVSSTNNPRPSPFWLPPPNPSAGYGRYSATEYYHPLLYTQPFDHVGTSAPSINSFYSPSFSNFDGLLSPLPAQSLLSPLHHRSSPSNKISGVTHSHTASSSDDYGRTEVAHSSSCSTDVATVQNKMLSPNSKYSSHEDKGFSSVIKTSPTHQSQCNDSKGANCTNKISKNLSNNNKNEKPCKNTGEFFDATKFAVTMNDKGLLKQCNNYDANSRLKDANYSHDKDIKNVCKSSNDYGKRVPFVEAKPLKINVNDYANEQDRYSLPVYNYKPKHEEKQMILVPPVQHHHHHKLLQHSVEKMVSPSFSKSYDDQKSSKPSTFTSVLSLATSSKQCEPMLSPNISVREYQSKHCLKPIKDVKHSLPFHKCSNISDDFAFESSRTLEYSKDKICDDPSEEKYQHNSEKFFSNEMLKPQSEIGGSSSSCLSQFSPIRLPPPSTECSLNLLNIKTESCDVAQSSEIKPSYDKRPSDKSRDKSKKSSAIQKLGSYGVDGSIGANCTPVIPVGIAVGRRRHDQTIKRSESVSNFSSSSGTKFEPNSDMSREQKGRSYLGPLPPSSPSDFPLFLAGNNGWSNASGSQAVLIPPTRLTTTTSTTTANNSNKLWSQASSSHDALPNLHPPQPVWLSPHAASPLSSFTHHPHPHLPIPVPTLTASGSSVDPSHLPIVPVGYQLTRDHITGHVFLIPATPSLGDMMERWGAPNSTAQYHNHASVAVHHYQQLVAGQNASHSTQLQQMCSQQIQNATTSTSINNHTCGSSHNEAYTIHLKSKSSHHHHYHSEPDHPSPSENEVNCVDINKSADKPFSVNEGSAINEENVTSSDYVVNSGECQPLEENTEISSESCEPMISKELCKESQSIEDCVEDNNFKKSDNLKDTPTNSNYEIIQSDHECPLLPTLQVAETCSKESKEVVDFIDNHGLNLLLNSIEEHESDDMPKLEKQGGTSPFRHASTDDDLSIPPLSSPEISPCEDRCHHPFQKQASPPVVLTNLDPVSSNGLGLLCALAEQRFKEEIEGMKPSADNKSSDISNENDINHNQIRPMIRDRLPSGNQIDSPPHSSPPNISNLTDGQCKMYSSELEREIADVQRKYKERQRQLAKLKSKKLKDESNKFSKRSAFEQSMSVNKRKPKKKSRSEKKKIISSEPSNSVSNFENSDDCLFENNLTIDKCSSESPKEVLHQAMDDENCDNFPSKIIEDNRCSVFSSNDEDDYNDIGEVQNVIKMKSTQQTDETVENSINTSGSKRKPGRPKKHSPIKDECATETIVAKKLKLSPNKLRTVLYNGQPASSVVKSVRTHKDSTFASTKDEQVEPPQKSLLYDELAWNRRRSERIFLSEHHKQDIEDHAEANLGKRKSSKLQSKSHSLCKKVKTNAKKTKEFVESQNHNSPENYEDSNNNNGKKSIEMPTKGTSKDKHCCVITVDTLEDGLRVLVPKEGLFYQGRVNTVSPPDLYKIIIDGERGNKGNIYSQEEILRDLIIEKKVKNLAELQAGTRICASWSQQYKWLYPGTVAKCSSPHRIPDKTLIDVEFDDGDSGRIELCEIFLLPTDYPIVSVDPNPIMIGKRRRRVSSGEGLNGNIDNKAASKDKPVNNLVIFEEPKEVPDSSNTVDVEQTVSTSDELEKCSGELKSLQICSKSKKSTLELLTLHSQSLQKVNEQGGLMKLSHHEKVNKKKSKKRLDDGKKSEERKRKHKKRTHKEKSHHRHHHRRKHHHKHHKKHRHGNGNISSKHHQSSDDKQVTIISPSSSSSLTSSASHLTVRIRTSSGGDPATAITTTTTKTVSQQNLSEFCSIKSSTSSDTIENGTSLPTTIDTTSEDDESNIDEDNSSSCSWASSMQQQSDNIKAKKKSTKSNKYKKTDRLAASVVESRSKIAAFLPAKKIWRWSGEHYRRNTMKGKAKKVFYKSITRGKEIIQVGDSAVFMSTGRLNLPYIGHIESMWESWGGNMIVKVKWYYHPQETNKMGNCLRFLQGALYQSTHEDENDVQTISHKCDVVSFDVYMSRVNNNNNDDSLTDESSMSDQNDLYYLAGSYEPTTGVVNIGPDIAKK